MRVGVLCAAIAALLLAPAQMGAACDVSRAVVVFDGDSLTKGYGIPVPYRHSSQVDDMARGEWVVGNVAIGGQTLVNMLDADDVDALYDGCARENVVVAWGGTNDLYFGADASDTYAAYVDYSEARRAAGWRVVVFTVLPRSNGGTPSGFEAERQELNGRIRDEWATWADGLVDIANDARLHDESDAFWYQDRVHVTGAGAAVVADSVFDVVVALIGELQGAIMAGTNPGTTDLVAWWSFDTDGTDSHGSNNLSANNGPISHAAGVVGNGADFEEASSQYYDITDNADLSVTTDFAVALWTIPESLAANEPLFGKVLGAYREYFADTGASGTSVRFAARNSADSAWQIAEKTNVLSAGVAAFVVCWYDSSAQKVYVQVDNGTPAEAAATGGVNDEAAPFEVGGFTAFGWYYDGIIDELAFRNGSVWSADERTWLYNSGAGRSYSELTGGTIVPLAMMHYARLRRQ